MGIWRLSFIQVHFGFFLSSLLSVTGSTELKITVEEGTIIHINNSLSTKSDCQVCIKQNSQRLCQSSVVLKNNILLDFSCSQPENIFTVQIIREIVSILNTEAKEQHAFQKFNRTFTWSLKPPARKAFNLNFSRAGLRQIQAAEICPDKHTYMLTVGNVIVGRFCQSGTIRQVDVRNVGKLSLEVSGGRLLDMKVIGVSVGDIFSSLVNIHVALPEKSSPQDFLSPNYPDSFPDNAETKWLFNVPPKYYTNVRLLNHTLPKCQDRMKYPVMKYSWKGKDDLEKQLNTDQPSEEPGNFTLSLVNCKMSYPPSTGLLVHFQISAKKMNNRVQCEGFLPEKEALQIHVKNLNCILKSDSLVLKTITIASGSHYELSFIDCNKDDLELTVNQTIECNEWRNCTFTPFHLNFNYQHHCIPGVLKKIVWHLHGPENSTVELQSPAGGLCQSLPEQKCNSNVLLNVSHVSHGTVGQFCPQGPVQKIQIKESRATVTASLSSISGLKQAANPILKYSFIQEISEDYIFTVAPKRDDSVLLATPAWPLGMQPSCTVSWIVTLDPQSKGLLEFRNVSQLKCKKGHTSITVQTFNSGELKYNSREDKNTKNVSVPESFYLNITNCDVVTYKAMMQITLKSSKNEFLAIILGIVGALLVVIVIAVVICCVIRKKKRSVAPPISVYNPSQHAVLPGLHGVPKTLQEEDPHTYVYIDDTLVYCHLLSDDTGHKQSNEPAVNLKGPPLPERPIKRAEKALPEDHTLVDNELYGFVQGRCVEGNYEVRL